MQIKKVCISLLVITITINSLIVAASYFIEMSWTSSHYGVHLRRGVFVIESGPPEFPWDYPGFRIGYYERDPFDFEIDMGNHWRPSVVSGGGWQRYELPLIWIVLFSMILLLMSRKIRSCSSSENCKNCGYPRFGLPSLRCPECGIIGEANPTVSVSPGKPVCGTKRGPIGGPGPIGRGPGAPDKI